eukprot:COSAG01_NODE_68075_length_265_cov_0.620482_1_plen_59_part_10
MEHEAIAVSFPRVLMSPGWQRPVTNSAGVWNTTYLLRHIARIELRCPIDMLGASTIAMG